MYKGIVFNSSTVGWSEKYDYYDYIEQKLVLRQISEIKE